MNEPRDLWDVHELCNANECSQYQYLSVWKEQTRVAILVVCVRTCFCFCRCAEALKRNKTLIASDQKEYQRELEKNYQRFHDSIKPMLAYNSEMHAADELENSTGNSTC